MIHSAIARLPVAALLAVGVATGIGCGKSTPTGTVSGTVTYEGKPVEEGVVEFANLETGGGANAKLEAGGKFSLEKPLEVGKYLVIITPPTIDDLPEGAGDPEKMPKPKKYPNIPPGYRSRDTTDLEATVKEGENDFPLAMKKGGGKQTGPAEQDAP